MTEQLNMTWKVAPTNATFDYVDRDGSHSTWKIELLEVDQKMRKALTFAPRAKVLLAIYHVPAEANPMGSPSWVMERRENGDSALMPLWSGEKDPNNPTINELLVEGEELVDQLKQMAEMTQDLHHGASYAPLSTRWNDIPLMATFQAPNEDGEMQEWLWITNMEQPEQMVDTLQLQYEPGKAAYTIYRDKGIFYYLRCTTQAGRLWLDGEQPGLNPTVEQILDELTNAENR